MEFKREIGRTIDRYRKLWDFRELDPPLIMIDIPESCASAGGHDCAFWADPDAFVQKHLPSLSLRRFIPDDTIPMLRPPFSHAALPAILGTVPELHEGKLWVRPILDDLIKHRIVSFAEDSYWLDTFKRYYERLLEVSEDRFAIGLYETPAPADLMGALRGYETILLDLYDFPDIVHDFASHVAELAVAFHEWVHGLLTKQENYGGCWIANSWAPEDTIYFCEHTSVNYSPSLYEDFLKPANSSLLADYGHALTYVYYKAGSQHITNYFSRGCPVWIRSCDGDPSPQMVERFQGQAIVTIHTTADDFVDSYSRYGGVGICYTVRCASLNEVKAFCSSVGFRE